MRPRGEHHLAAIGAVTLVALVLGVLAAFFSDELPIIGGGTTYSAYFAESAGLVSGNEVRVAGVKVGRVSRVSLARNQVLVDFKVRGAWIGDRTTASIQIKTVLGDKYLALVPEGLAAQDPRQRIPKSRTQSPFDVTDAINQLSTTVGRIDSAQLARSFQVVAESFKNTPQSMKEALAGLSALSKTISSRDERLATLLSNTSQTSAILASRDEQVRQLLADGNQLLSEVQRRKDAVSALLRGTQELANQLRGLVADNKAQLKPALTQLEQVTAALSRNQDNLSRALASLTPFVRVFNNTIGNGRWFDGYICGLLPPAQATAGLKINPEGCTTPLFNPNLNTGGGR